MKAPVHAGDTFGVAPFMLLALHRRLRAAWLSSREWLDAPAVADPLDQRNARTMMLTCLVAFAVLFTISNKVYEQEAQKAKAEVLSATAELTSAQVELDNTEKLLAKDIVASPELTAMRAKVASLEAQVAQAKSEQARAETLALAENMCLVVQPNVITRDQKAGVQVGNLVRVTKDGCESLQRIPLAFFRAGQAI